MAHNGQWHGSSFIIYIIFKYTVHVLKTMDSFQQVIDKCRLPKLRRNLEESEKHPEFELWEKNLSVYFEKVKVMLCDINFQQYNDNASVIASLFILFSELQSEGPWQSEKVKECMELMKIHFDLLYSISLEKMLGNKTNNIFNTQEVFDKCMELLHRQLTEENFKKCPALIEVYFSIITKLQDYELVLRPASLLPVSLLLIDDYINENRIKGLQCCSTILQCLSPNDFQEGNYYEVIYSLLKKLITEKESKVTNLVLECLRNLFEIMPADAKMTSIDDTLHIVLEQLYVETNLYKKKAVFSFVNKLIPMHGVHCVKRRMFLTVICDNLDICSNDSVAEILLEDVIECLENWIGYCWCIWRIQPNNKLLSVLIKTLYIYCENEKFSGRLKNILITLLHLCSKEKQKQIHDHIEHQIQESKFKECFIKELNVIKTEIKSP